jgi:cytochrome c-type biogenesis protein CcmH/NrfF
LIKATEAVRAEDYPEIEPELLTAFKKAITTGLTMASVATWIMLCPYLAFCTYDNFVLQTKHSAEGYMLLAIMPIVIFLIGGALVRNAQRRAIELGKRIGLIV